MRVLITGGAGFIGSHLAERMIARGDDVAVLDDLSTGSLDNIEQLRTAPRFRCVIGSAADARMVAEVMESCEVVVHLAAAVGVRLVLERPVHAIENNLFATGVVLAAAADAIARGKRKLVLVASTSEVYGKNSKVPFGESDDVTLGPTVNSRWAYACSKAMDEWLAFAYWRERQLPTIVARFFNTVGTRQTGRYGMVLPTFAEQALAGAPITVFGSGEQSRCFCHVDDTVEAMLRLLDTPAAVGEVFNVGSDREVRMLDLAEAVRREAGSDSPIQLLPYERAYAVGFEDMQRRVPDPEKLYRFTGFRPSIPLERIIADVVADWRARTVAT